MSLTTAVSRLTRASGDDIRSLSFDVSKLLSTDDSEVFRVCWLILRQVRSVVDVKSMIDSNTARAFFDVCKDSDGFSHVFIGLTVVYDLDMYGGGSSFDIDNKLASSIVDKIREMNLHVVFDRVQVNDVIYIGGVRQ